MICGAVQPCRISFLLRTKSLDGDALGLSTNRYLSGSTVKFGEPRDQSATSRLHIWNIHLQCSYFSFVMNILLYFQYNYYFVYNRPDANGPCNKTISSR